MVTIEERKPEKLPGITNIFVKFDYNPQIVEFIKSLPNRIYHKDTQEWELPINRLAFIINILNEDFLLIPLNTISKETIEIPKDYKFKTQPFEHQIEAIEFGLNHNNWILGDEQGLGKSLTSINIASILKHLGKIKHCLVVCGVNSLKWNWLAEIDRHSYEKAHILGSYYNKKDKLVIGDVKSRIEDLKCIDDNTLFLITNIETLRDDDFIEQLKKSDIDMIIVDEIHRAKSPTSEQGKNLLKTKYVKYKIALTGTLIMNSPIDAYTPLKWLEIEQANFTNFKAYYCIFGGYGDRQIVGYKNLALLQKILSNNMLRRLKSERLNLPPKIHQVEYIELGTKQRHLYNNILDNLLQDVDLISMSNNPLEKLTRLRQVTDCPSIVSSGITENAKLDRLEQFVEDIILDGRKCIIFSNWEKVTSQIKERLLKYKPAYVAGTEINDVDVQKEISRFQNSPDCNVIIGTIGKLGTGWTLTAANHVIFIDDPWNKATKEQAEDRAYRIGTTDTVFITTFVAKDTIDEKIEDLVYQKGAIAEMIVDGTIPTGKYQELVKYLLSN